jgi:hypothetical protein
MSNKRGRIILFLAITAIAVIGITLLPPIPQQQEYHDFADQRSFLGIPNLMDVISNLPFLAIGLWGLGIIKFSKRQDSSKAIVFTVFLGFCLLLFGSGIYHWNPSNLSLALDRLAMAIIFMSFFALIIHDYLGANVGRFLLVWLVLLGILSIFWWYGSEVSGTGDLRMYILVQYYPVVAIPLLMVLFNSQFNYNREIFFIYLFFILAKIAEDMDEAIFIRTGIISGHTIKHLFMAVSGVFIVLLYKRRHSQLQQLQ